MISIWPRQCRRFFLLAGMMMLAGGFWQVEAKDPDALWKIVDGQCVRHQNETGSPGPCVLLDLSAGAGIAVLKDRDGIAQFLLIPTKKLTGVESPELLASDAPNYWAYAWQAKRFVEESLQRPLARDQVALAINSAYGRSQRQLHIHVDCIRSDVRESLLRSVGHIGEQWAPLEEPLSGHPYWARRIRGEELGGSNPFKLLADGISLAGQHMDRQTLVLTGATFEDGSEGFLLLDDQADAATADRASGEELLDHACTLAGR